MKKQPAPPNPPPPPDNNDLHHLELSVLGGLMLQETLADAQRILSESKISHHYFQPGPGRLIFSQIEGLANPFAPNPVLPAPDALAVFLPGEVAAIGGAVASAAMQSLPTAIEALRKAAMTVKARDFMGGWIQSGGDVQALEFAMDRLREQFPAPQAETCGEAMSLADIPSIEHGDPDELIRRRFLCRGGGAILNSQSGIGKSTVALQIAAFFAIGRGTLGLDPVRPLRCLIIQAENDPGDLAEFRDGLRRGMGEAGIPVEQVEAALRAVKIITCDDRAGDRFFGFLRAALAGNPCDIIFLDPLLAYIGGDVSDQTTVSEFLRNQLNPVIREHKVGIIVIHHTNKPAAAKNQFAPAMGDTDFSYLGSGSAELANWARAVLTVQAVKGSAGIFQLRGAKRGKRLGWKDADGNRVNTRYIAHATEPGHIYWREPSAAEVEAAGSATAAADAGAARTPGRPLKATASDIAAALEKHLAGNVATLPEVKAWLEESYRIGEKKREAAIALAEDRRAVKRRIFVAEDGSRVTLLGLPGEVENWRPAMIQPEIGEG